MNLDFHYYGTYYAATLAGYEKDAAEKIAWAAQMVDEATSSFAQEHGLQKTEAIATVESTSEMAADETSLLHDENNLTLQKIRGIWMPFHFLPGNFKDEDQSLEYSGARQCKHIWHYTERDVHDFQCMCRPNSKLAKEVVKNLSTSVGKDHHLYHVGVVMHVIADTWAHQYFVGSPNYWVNEINEKDVTGEALGSTGVLDEIGEWLLGKVSSPSSYSVNYLGHARIGHIPDYGCLRYSYIPRWSAARVTIDNQERFFKAFCTMTHILTQLRTGGTANIDSFQGENVDTPDVVREKEHVIKQALAMEVKDQSELFKALIRGVQGHDVPGFSTEKSNEELRFSTEKSNEELKAFMRAAAEHKAVVMGKLGDEKIYIR